MRTLVYLPAALADLRSLALYIAEDNPDRAVSFIDELRQVAARTAEHPGSFPMRVDLEPDLRVTIHRRYLIFFRFVEDTVEIVRVLHGARDLNAYSMHEHAVRVSIQGAGSGEVVRRERRDDDRSVEIQHQ